MAAIMDHLFLSVYGEKETVGFCEGPAHGWEREMEWVAREGGLVEDGGQTCVAPWSELAARGATGQEIPDKMAIRAWLADGAPGAIERVWSPEAGAYVVPS
jgi:hypothetical protein